ncbi:MAG: esterase, partial [Chloroflexota bacterium]
THITLVCGQGTWDEASLNDTYRLSDLFKRKKINHTLDIWGHDVIPDWYWWQKEIYHHLKKSIVG